MTNEAPANIVIRDLEDKDLPIIQSIYAGQVLHSVSSWEETPFGLAEMTKRQDGIVNLGYPYPIPVRDDEVIAKAKELNVPMVLTGRRHFRH